MTNYSIMGMVRVTWPIFACNHIFGTGKASHVRFPMLIDIEEYQCIWLLGNRIVGLLNFTPSHLHSKCGSMSKTVQLARWSYCYYRPLIGYGVWLIKKRQFGWPLVTFKVICLLHTLPNVIFSYSVQTRFQQT